MALPFKKNGIRESHQEVDIGPNFFSSARLFFLLEEWKVTVLDVLVVIICTEAFRYSCDVFLSF